MSDIQPGASPPRVSIIGACYYLAPATFAQRMRQLVRSLEGDAGPISTQFVAIDAARLHDETSRLPPYWLVSTGGFLDISAYSTAALTSAPADVHLLLNDTLFVKHPWRLIMRRVRALIRTLALMPGLAACGEVHPSTDLLMADRDNPNRRHLSTFCFALNEAAFSMFKDIAATLPDGHDEHRVKAWLDAQMQRHSALEKLLYVHLTGPLNPWSWPRLSKAQISPQLLDRKAVTVVFEYLLTHQLLLQGGLIMPINTGPRYRLEATLWALRG